MIFLGGIFSLISESEKLRLRLSGWVRGPSSQLVRDSAGIWVQGMFHSRDGPSNYIAYCLPNVELPDLHLLYWLYSWNNGVCVCVCVRTRACVYVWQIGGWRGVYWNSPWEYSLLNMLKIKQLYQQNPRLLLNIPCSQTPPSWKSLAFPVQLREEDLTSSRMTSKNKGITNNKHCTTMLIHAPKGRQQEKPRVCQMEKQLNW